MDTVGDMSDYVSYKSDILGFWEALYLLEQVAVLAYAQAVHWHVNAYCVTSPKQGKKDAQLRAPKTNHVRLGVLYI